MSVLNIAGPEYDFGSVVFVVLGECEHRRRSFENDELEFQLMETAKAKLKKIKAAYDEFGGSPTYWKALQSEVLETAMPQYIQAAKEMNGHERNSFGVWRGGDPAARIAFALGGLVIGGILIALPFWPIVERLFAFVLGGAGFAYPDIKRYTHERRHYRALNRIIGEAAAYQRNAKLHYMTTTDIRESFHVGSAESETTASEATEARE